MASLNLVQILGTILNLTQATKFSMWLVEGEGGNYMVNFFCLASSIVQFVCSIFVLVHLFIINSYDEL